MRALEEPLSIDQIVAALMDTVQRNLGPAALYLAGMAGLGSVMDIMGWAEGGGQLVLSIAGLAGGYLLLLAFMRGTGLLAQGTSAGFGSYFGLSLLSGLGTLVGFLLLIVPGVVLMVRWSLAFPILFAEDETVTRALSESWDVTRPHFWPLLTVSLLCILPLFAGLGLYFFMDQWPEGLWQAAAVAANVFLYLNVVLITALGVGVYSLISGEDETLPDIFS